MKKRALISVYDKSYIVDFAKALIELGWEIISTGGTEALLKEEGLEVIGVEEVTQSPEILGGRVKSLHPAIHAGILNRRDKEEDQEDLRDLGIQSIDMVVNNLYPFEKTVNNPDSSQQDIIENIDIGGPSMVRAAAKNYQDVIIVTAVEDYDLVIEALRHDQMTEDKRAKLATKAFALTAYYDAMIARYFLDRGHIDFLPYFTQPYRFSEELRYGENPHQKAVFYSHPLEKEYEMEQLHGKALSYNNFNDMKAAIDLVKEFDQPAAVAVKHANPCGVAVGDSLAEAYAKAYRTDTESIYGGIIALNRPVDLETAELLHDIFLEIVVAPSFQEDALARLTTKKNIRLIEMPRIAEEQKAGLHFRQSLDGLLVQEKDLEIYQDQKFELKTDRPVSPEEKASLDFAWRVAKHIASNGIVIAKDGATLGLGHGEVRRVWALEKALERSEQSLEGAVAASDGFFFEDTIETLADYGIKAIIQPGGSIQDEAVLDKANELGISVVFTGMRHFKH